MMKGINDFIFFILFDFLLCTSAKDFLSHTVTDIEGNDVSLEKYRGNAVLVVNVASQCGFTDKHYKQMTKAHEIFGKTGKFHILAFPCNQFGGQEPEDNGDVLKFARETYGVKFPMFSKIDVKGNSISPAWKVLTDESGEVPGWNFFKYLIDHTGKVVGRWGPWSDLEEIWHTIRGVVEDAVAADKHGEEASAQTTADHKAPAPPKEQTRQPVHDSPPSHDDL